jgi:hypothetical protein
VGYHIRKTGRQSKLQKISELFNLEKRTTHQGRPYAKHTTEERKKKQEKKKRKCEASKETRREARIDTKKNVEKKREPK